MTYAINLLKRKLQALKQRKLVHGNLTGNKVYAASAKHAAEAIPQVEQAIEILTNHKP